MLVLAMMALTQAAAAPAPLYYQLEAERFDGVSGHYPSWMAEVPARGWHWNGPGVAAEWGQGGESGFNSISCAARADGSALASRTIELPRAGRYRLWVRYSESREGPTPVTVRLRQGARIVLTQAVGTRATLDPQDEALSYWGWTFVWGHVDARLAAGPVTIALGCNHPAADRRIVDMLVLTDDLGWQAAGREPPPFGYLRALARWRDGEEKVPPAPRFDPPRAEQPPPLVVPWNFKPDSFVPGRPPFIVEPQIRKAFLDQFRSGAIPIFSSKLVVPVFTLDELPALLGPGAAARRLLDSTREPFYVLINYQRGEWRKKDDLQKLVTEARRALAAQDRGDISGENIGYPWDTPGHTIESALAAALAKTRTRAEALEAIRATYEAALADKQRELYGDTGSPWPRLIAALSTGSDSFVHALARWGCRTLGLETADGMPDFARRIAFVRGAARQYRRDWLYYHAPNFGDSASTFTVSQNFAGPSSWYHSRYGLVFGPSIAWYRKALFQEWFSGAGAIYLEQGFDQFFQPGPGKHPVELDPLGRVTDAFLKFAAAHPERGTPVAPVALLLDRAHGWDDAEYLPRAWNIDAAATVLRPTRADRSIAQTLDALYYPNAMVQGEPATAERQAFVHAMLGDGADVLVADEGAPIADYRVLVVAGQVDVPPSLARAISDRVASGALTLLLARGGAPALEPLCGRPHVVCAEAPLGLAPDGSADPEWAVAIANAVWAAEPVHVSGDVEWAVDRTRAGYEVLLMNSRGNDKPQQGLAIAPHRDQFADVELDAGGVVRARELVGGQPLAVKPGAPVRLRVPAGAIRIVELSLGR